MGTRILTFHGANRMGDVVRLGATYYIEADYTPVAVRIYARDIPISADAKIDIYDDGVSIFNNRTLSDLDLDTGKVTTGVAVTAAVLGAGLHAEEYAEDFATDIDGEYVIIEKGSWVHCTLDNTGGGNNFSVHLELYTGDEELTEEE